MADFFVDGVDPADILLLESDIQDKHVHIDLENLHNYSKEHTMQWLVYRGDSLKGISNLKDAKSRVLKYFDNKMNDHIVDPTLDLKWKRLKAARIGCKSNINLITDVSVCVPSELSFELGSLKSFDGWSKTLDGIPQSFSHDHVVKYHNEINLKHTSSANLVKKNFDRGQQFLEEQYIDLFLFM